MELPWAAPPTTCVAHSILPYVPHEGLRDVTLPVLPDHLAGPVPSLPTLAMLRGCVNTLNVLLLPWALRTSSSLFAENLSPLVPSESGSS